MIKKDYPDDWDKIIKRIKRRDRYTCQKCRTKHPKNSPYLKVHHIVPLSKGGSNLDSNLITLCSKCHIDTHPHLRKLYEQGKTPSRKSGSWKKYLGRGESGTYGRSHTKRRPVL